MRFRIIAPALVFAGGLAFAGAASAESVTVVQSPDQSGAVVVEHPAPPPVVVEHPAPPPAVVVAPAPPVVVEHRAADCDSRKVVNFHGDGTKSTHTTTDCEE
jgi:hypothetical protein